MRNMTLGPTISAQRFERVDGDVPTPFQLDEWADRRPGDRPATVRLLPRGQCVEVSGDDLVVEKATAPALWRRRPVERLLDVAGRLRIEINQPGGNESLRDPVKLARGTRAIGRVLQERQDR